MKRCQFTPRPGVGCESPAHVVLTFQGRSFPIGQNRVAVGLAWDEALCQGHEEVRTHQVRAEGGTLTDAAMIEAAS